MLEWSRRWGIVDPYVLYVTHTEHPHYLNVWIENKGTNSMPQCYLFVLYPACSVIYWELMTLYLCCNCTTIDLIQYFGTSIISNTNSLFSWEIENSHFLHNNVKKAGYSLFYKMNVLWKGNIISCNFFLSITHVETQMLIRNTVLGIIIYTGVGVCVRHFFTWNVTFANMSVASGFTRTSVSEFDRFYIIGNDWQF